MIDPDRDLRSSDDWVSSSPGVVEFRVALPAIQYYTRSAFSSPGVWGERAGGD
jgi:hypothetical protein